MQERKLYTLEEKRLHVASWRASGLNRQQYCEVHDIKLSTIPGMAAGYQSGTQG